jgi:hypothetical protein
MRHIADDRLPTPFGESGWRIMCPDEVQRITVPVVNISEGGVADTNRIL